MNLRGCGLAILIFLALIGAVTILFFVTCLLMFSANKIR